MSTGDDPVCDNPACDAPMGNGAVDDGVGNVLDAEMPAAANV